MAEQEADTEIPKLPDYTVGDLADGTDRILAGLSLGNQIVNNNAQQQNFINHQQAMNQLNLVTLAKSIALAGSVPSESSTLSQLQEMMQLFNQQVGSLGNLPTPGATSGEAESTEQDDSPNGLRTEITRIRQELTALEKRIPK